MSIDFKQVKEVFLAAVDQADPNQRQAFLLQACAGNAALRRKVEALLGRHEQTGRFLEQPAFEATTFVPLSELDESANESAGINLDRYELVQKIGEGGMGTVWLAQQEEPIRRQVAIKVIRVGVESAHAVARLEAERQALALMDHPNIAKVLDGGTTADGRPYFVMDLVQGTPITHYCDQHRLLPRHRLELFITVCRALQHAHQKGIIHRDIKPSNVLVASYDNRPMVKVIDFGIAKAAGQRLTGRTLQTEFGAVVGTLEYMSPEQAELTNQDIDTRSDVYSLGVLLYELLTGTTPLTSKRLKESNVLELLRAIREEEPPRPSIRVSDSKESLTDISARQQTEPAKLRKLLRRELDWIVLKALEKDRSRRYETANGLARDVERYLNDETVEACPPSAGYRLRKFLRRHKGPVAAAGGILAALILGLVGTLLFAAGEAEQRRKADAASKLADERRDAALEEASSALEVANFLGGLFEEADPFVLTGRVFGEQPNTNPTAMDIVNRGATRLANPDTFKTKPLVRASLLDKVGHVYMSLGEGAKAGPFVIEALDLRRKHLPAVHPDLAASLHNVGFLHLIKGNLKPSKELFAAALDMRTQLFGSKSAPAMTSRLHLAIAQTKLSEDAAEKLLLEVLESQRARLKVAREQHSEAVGPLALECSFTLITLCHFYALRSQFLKAAPHLQEAHQVLKQIPNKDLAALGAHLIGYLSWQAIGNTDRAVKEIRQGLAIIEKQSGKHHYVYVILEREIANQHFDGGRFVEAEKAYLAVQDNYRTTIGGDGGGLAGIYYNTARSIQRGALVQAKDLEESRVQGARVEKYARAAYRQAKENGVEARDLSTYAVFLAHTLLYHRSEPDNAGAEEVAREALRIRNEIYGVGDVLSCHPLAYLLLALARQDKVDAIEKTILELLAHNPRPKWQHNAADALPEAARKLARTGKNKTALLLLEQVARAGFYNINDVRSDPTFVSLQDTEEYRQLRKKLEK
jgi:tetratricopeptide (TPR) repeat protein